MRNDKDFLLCFFMKHGLFFESTDSSNSSACGADDCCRGKKSEKSINVLFLIRLINFF